jgi:hypothetical protein
MIKQRAQAPSLSEQSMVLALSGISGRGRHSNEPMATGGQVVVASYTANSLAS